MTYYAHFWELIYLGFDISILVFTIIIGLILAVALGDIARSWRAKKGIDKWLH